MKNIDTLSSICRCSLFSFILLSILTLGVYPLIWLYRAQHLFSEEFEGEYWSMKLPGVMIITTSVSQLLSVIFSSLENGQILNTFDFLGIGVYILLWIHWGFRMKCALQEYTIKYFYFKAHINNFLLVALVPVYIVHVLNSLSKEHKDQQIFDN